MTYTPDAGIRVMCCLRKNRSSLLSERVFCQFNLNVKCREILLHCHIISELYVLNSSHGTNVSGVFDV